jgi:hypothetical protein
MKDTLGHVATKAYQIDFSKISEGFTFDVIYCHAVTMNEAKYSLLKKIRYDGLKLLYSDEEISYKNIPVIRYKNADLIEFEGKYIMRSEIDRIIAKRKRQDYFNTILDNPTVSHCYIRKHGSYYRPHACGYTSFRSFAGIYTKQDAVKHGNSCDELQIIPIETTDHNQMIEDEIKYMQSRIINT